MMRLRVRRGGGRLGESAFPAGTVFFWVQVLRQHTLARKLYDTVLHFRPFDLGFLSLPSEYQFLYVGEREFFGGVKGRS